MHEPNHCRTGCCRGKRAHKSRTCHKTHALFLSGPSPTTSPAALLGFPPAYTCSEKLLNRLVMHTTTITRFASPFILTSRLRPLVHRHRPLPYHTMPPKFYLLENKQRKCSVSQSALTVCPLLEVIVRTNLLAPPPFLPFFGPAVFVFVPAACDIN